MKTLEAAARSRGEADWLVGMNGTRAATKVGWLEGVVSLGRVQTPTLALIVRRDLEIDAFVPETYFQVDARFALPESRDVPGRWFAGKEDRLAERERADEIATPPPAPTRRSSRSSAPSASRGRRCSTT